MTGRDELPDPVRRFIIERIDSVPQLEALIMMSVEPRAWTVAEIAARTYVPPDRARALLESLQRTRLLATGEPAGSYVFAPTDASDRERVSQVAHEYRANLILVATLIQFRTSRWVHYG